MILVDLFNTSRLAVVRWIRQRHVVTNEARAGVDADNEAAIARVSSVALRQSAGKVRSWFRGTSSSFPEIAFVQKRRRTGQTVRRVLRSEPHLSWSQKSPCRSPGTHLPYQGLGLRHMSIFGHRKIACAIRSARHGESKHAAAIRWLESD